MRDQIRGDIDTILDHLASVAMPHTTEDQEQNPQAPIRFIDIHVYDLAPDEEEPSIIESTVQSQEPTQSTQEHVTTPRQHLTRWYVWTALVIVCALVGTGVATMLFLVPTWTPSATVTIVPVSKQMTTTSTITVVPGAADPAHHQLAGRVFSSVTMSQARTIATTGRSHQNAKAAQGYITFYNAATYPQVIAAGTLLTGADSVQVVTDQDATIPAASYPTFGQASVRAQSAITGPGGNIRTGDIYGPCCRLNVSAVNSVFSGGQEARDYQIATQQDINTVVASLKMSLNQSIQAALQTQVHSDETLITPLPCQQDVKPDHQPGDEAAHVNILVSETCMGMTYTTQAYQNCIMQIANQQATHQLGDGYTPIGQVQSTITQAVVQEHNRIDLQVTLAETYAYQVSQEQLQQIKALIAGENKAQATNTLLHLPGIQSVSVSSATLPTDTKHIRVIVVYIG